MNRRLHQRQSGFTLIELMVVVAIIGLLAAIAVPQYQDYVARSRWSDSIQEAGQLKSTIGECIQNNSGNVAASDCLDIAGLKAGEYLPSSFPTAIPSTKFGASISIASAAIRVDGTGQPKLANCIVTLTPSLVTGGTLNWTFSTTGAAGCNKNRTGVGAI